MRQQNLCVYLLIFILLYIFILINLLCNQVKKMEEPNTKMCYKG